MAAPRHQLVDPATSGYYHCVTRCVRRAFLCGADPLSGRSFDHRKTWIESRLIELAEIFAVGLYACAVMSNHVHAVAHVDPATAAGWPDAEVAERWVRLFPARANGEPDAEGCLRRRDAILGNPDRLAQCRLRLGSLSWFMRCLAEPIARRANREDGCTGRFWEGRFKCQALLDDAAVLSCMSYVDLNPVRAGIAPDLPSSAHTSVKRRIETTRPPVRGEPLRAIAGSIIEPTLPRTGENWDTHNSQISYQLTNRNRDTHSSPPSYDLAREFRTPSPIGPCHASPMAAPRHQLVDPATSGYYHCVTRCVRRAFLCGADPLSGRSFDHRKTWIESRLIELAEIFAVGLYAYAVMSNHVHAVVHVDPGTAAGWPDSEVAERWVRLFPARANGEPDAEGCLRRRDAILGNPDRLAQCRLRLGSLSWFMRCLAEPIARRANREDGCTGRFWEGRFKCQALLDDAAVLSCMSYVDLNPVRAGIAPDLPSSAHTSVKRRIETTRPPVRGEPLRAIAGSIIEPTLPVALVEYLALVDWTGSTTRPDKRGAIRGDAPPVLSRIGLRPRQWQVQVLGTESRYWRAIGAADRLLEKAEAIGQRWLKGIGTTRALQARPVASIA